MPTYFLRVNPVNNDKPETWEEVDDFVFNNRDKCLSGENARYSGDYIITEENKPPVICIMNNSPTTMIVGLKLAGVNRLVVETLFASKDIVKKPEMIKFRVNKRTTKVHENFQTTENLTVG